MTKPLSAKATTSWSGIELISAYLRHVDPVAREALNAWLASRADGVFSLDGQNFQLSWSGLLPTEFQLGLEIAFGSRRLALSFDSLAAFDPLLVGAPFSHMPVPMKNVAVQHLLARFLAKLPGALGHTADLRRIHWEAGAGSPWGCAVGITLQRLPDGGVSHGVFAVESPDTLAWLNAQLPASEPRPASTWRDVPISLQVLLGATRLPAADLHGLGIGDVVWMDTAQLTAEGVAATLFARRLRRTWACRVEQNRVLVAAPTASDVTVEELMRLHLLNVAGPGATLVKPKHGGNSSMETDLAGLEVPVTFDLGELSVAFDALEHIKPGHLFELPQDVASASVSLRVSGSTIARGQLVAVGRRLGVRITDLTRVGLDP